jgi:DNA polymerase-4
VPEPPRDWRTGDDVTHPAHGHGWVQGSGHGRVTVRFETATSGPGRAHTFRADDPDLARADPVASLG